jgi:dihydroorotase
MTRRELFGGVGGSFLASAASKVSAEVSMTDQKPYTVLVKGGRVVDPSQDLDSLRDVAMSETKIAAVEPDIPSGQAARVVDASGKIVRPGLIDLHTHVFPYVGPYGIEPDPYCVSRGVTTVLDAGTSGAEADIGVFELQEGELTFTDSDGKTRTGRQKVVPVATVKGGRLFPSIH